MSVLGQNPPRRSRWAWTSSESGILIHRNGTNRIGSLLDKAPGPLPAVASHWELKTPLVLLTLLLARMLLLQEDSEAQMPQRARRDIRSLTSWFSTCSFRKSDLPLSGMAWRKPQFRDVLRHLICPARGAEHATRAKRKVGSEFTKEGAGSQ